jgi:hypothetical protein
LAEMFIGWSYTRFVFLVLIGNPTWLPGPIMCQRRRLLNIFSIGSNVKIKSSHGGHLEFPISKRFTSLVQDHPMIIPAKPQFNWLSANLKQTWHGWSLGSILSKLCLVATTSIQDGCHEQT